MGLITDVVDVQVDAETASITREGFGVPLILSSLGAAAWEERVRIYSTLAEVLVDFPITTPEYQQAAILFSAKRRVSAVKIGRCALPPTQRFSVTPTVVNLAVYTMDVFDGASWQTVSYTADAATSASEIAVGLKAAIDALTLNHDMIASDQVTFLRLLSDTPGEFIGVRTSDKKLSILQDHVDPGVATDLAAIAAEDNDWYFLLTHFNSKLYVEAAAGWANAQPKFYFAQTQDETVRSTILSGTDDVAESLHSLAYDHVALIWSRATTDFADAGIVGRCAPILPGGETWKFKKLIGVAPGTFTSTQRSNLRAKKVNFYETTKGQPMTEEGYTVGGDWIDLIRYLDYLKSNIQIAVFTPMVEEDKIAFNDDGISVVENAVAGELQKDEKRKVLNVGWTTTAPPLGDISQADKDARLLDPVTFEAVYSGAIHKAIIRGSVTQ